MRRERVVEERGDLSVNDRIGYLVFAASDEDDWGASAVHGVDRNRIEPRHQEVQALLAVGPRQREIL